MPETTFNLSADEVAALMRPLNGAGGFQSFGRSLQRAVKANGEISLTDAQLGRVIRHIRYTTGGFESRLIDAFGRSLRDILA